MVRPPREEAVDALGNLYRCRDGRWFLIALTPDGRRWQDFTAVIGRPELFADPRFATPTARRGNTRALIAILDAVVAERDWAEWRGVLEASGIAFGVVGTLDDIAHDPQMRDSGALVPLDDPRAGAALTVSSPLEDLREAGLDEADLARLQQAGVIVQGKPA